ncbi:MAG TPA: VCBS repeat-containing protein [Chitinophagaceae bacterium]|nr:VCBS repeat-containing protein [Chitinophagaceae bacterium]
MHTRNITFRNSLGWVAVFLASRLITGCTISENKQKPLVTGLGGDQLAAKYCSACHLKPDPAALDKKTWISGVLPNMSQYLGIKYYDHEPYLDAGYAPDSSLGPPPPHSFLSLADWKKLVDYYVRHAPDSLGGQGRPPVRRETGLFRGYPVQVPAHGFPSTTYVKIDPGNHRVYAASGFDSSLNVYDRRGHLLGHTPLGAIVVDMQFRQSLAGPGPRSGIFTHIGIMNPNDQRTGSVRGFELSQAGRVQPLPVLFDSLQRPVQVLEADLNQDGRPDYLVCAFGNRYGRLSWMENKGGGRFTAHLLRNLPGAIRACVQDMNGDGLPDVVVLMAQAQEGLFLFTNQGHGTFAQSDLLLFPPEYGSSYFELDDFNGDGHPDILYTCGDNADYSSGLLKNYHGVYIFLNDGANHYSRRYFFPLHGCYKAVAGDFDGDGDLDLAAISYFPDYRHQPQESFVYLENRGDFQFEPFTIPEFAAGHWISMDAGDVDGDGDTDLVLGSLIPPVAHLAGPLAAKPGPATSLLILENRSR